MTYNPNIPQATDLISNSQGQILVNFGQLNSQFGVDHQAFNGGSGNGDGTHKKITFDNAPSAPTPTGTVSNMYPALVNTFQEMMWKNASNTTQVTSGGQAIWKGGTTTPTGIVSLLNAASNNTNIMTLPNGVTLIWGVIASPGQGNFNQAFPSTGFPTNCLLVFLTLGRDNSSSTQNAYVNSHSAVGFTNGLSKTSFNYTTTGSSNSQLYYLAIGY